MNCSSALCSKHPFGGEVIQTSSGAARRQRGVRTLVEPQPIMGLVASMSREGTMRINAVFILAL